MRRKLFNLATALSLVVLIALLVACVRSYYVADMLKFVSDSRDCIQNIWWGRGRLSYQRYDMTANARAIPKTRSYVVQDPNYFINHSPLPGIRFAGFEIGRYAASTNRPVWTETRVIIPLYAMELLAALLPAVWFGKRFRIAQRSKRNLCPVCGYDLRATPERCPECGTPAPPANQCRIELLISVRNR